MASVLIEGVEKPSATINGREMTADEIEDIECALMTDICRCAESEQDNATGKNGVEGVDVVLGIQKGTQMPSRFSVRTSYGYRSY